MDSFIWFSVEEQLPDTERSVLICCLSKKGVKSYKIGYYVEDYNNWVMQGVAKVVAWADIPTYDPDFVPTPTLDDACESIRARYRMAKDSAWIEAPLAWSVYQEWKKIETVDGRKEKKR